MTFFRWVLMGGWLLMALTARAEEFMSVDEVRPGMKGYGLTVFHGTRPTTFGVELIGVLKGNLGPKHDMILCKLDHPILRDIGVVAGMSGSPVYINGKLLGALGYGYSESKRPVGGIAPILDMLKVYEQTSIKPHYPGEGRFGKRDPETGGIAPKSVFVDGSNGPAGLFHNAEEAARGMTLTPLRAPLQMSSCSPATLAFLKENWPGGASEIHVGSGGAGGVLVDAIASNEVTNGYSLGIPILTGDMSLQVTGTVTYREGDKLVAFGHPMDFVGDTNLPMAASWVHVVMPSAVRPFKISSSLNTIGVLRQDRLVAVGGVVGPTYEMIPITVHVEAPGQSAPQTYRFESVTDPSYLPMAAMTAASESLTASSKDGGEMSLDMEYAIHFTSGQVIRRADFASGSMATMLSAMSVMSDLRTVLNNPFEKIGAQEITLSARLTERVREAAMESLRPQRRIYRPGETVQLRATIRPYRSEPETFTASLTLPEDLSDGLYTVALLDASGRASLENSRAPGLRKARDLNHMFELLAVAYPSNRTYTVLQKTGAGMTIDGQALPHLPPSLIGALAASGREAIAPIRTIILAEEERAWPYEFNGAAETTITVRAED